MLRSSQMAGTQLLPCRVIYQVYHVDLLTCWAPAHEVFSFLPCRQKIYMLFLSFYTITMASHPCDTKLQCKVAVTLQNPRRIVQQVNRMDCNMPFGSNKINKHTSPIFMVLNFSTKECKGAWYCSNDLINRHQIGARVQLDEEQTNHDIRQIHRHESKLFIWIHPRNWLTLKWHTQTGNNGQSSSRSSQGETNI